MQASPAIDVRPSRESDRAMNRPSSTPESRSGSAVGDSRLAALLEAIARHRSTTAFAELFHLMAPRFKAYVMRAGTAPDAAEEVAQEAMIAVWRKAASYDPAKAAAATWLFTIVRNKRIDMLRRQARPELTEDDFRHLDDAPADPGEQLDAEQRARAVRARLAELPQTQAQVIEMAYFQDKSHRTIAEELDLPLGTVKSRIRLALARIGQAMGERAP